jgi:hypothetical protein
MQTGGIGSQDQWTRFMQVSNAARMRNQGLSVGTEGMKTVAARRMAAAGKTAPATRSPIRTAPLVNRNYSPAQSAAPARILGGKFDALA